MENICIRHNIICIGKEKFPVNGKVQCCRDELYDEYVIAQHIIDAIDDCVVSKDSITKVCSRISYAADTIPTDGNVERIELFPEFKRFSLIAYHYKEQILNDKNVQNLACSFIQDTRNWFSQSFMNGTTHCTIDSIKADLRTFEMMLGIDMTEHEFESDLDDIFF